MKPAIDDENMVKYQFQADDDEWQAWKRTVPRDKSLEQRINELIRADTDGRVVNEGETPDPEEIGHVVEEVEAALERGDRGDVEVALGRLREAAGVER